MHPSQSELVAAREEARCEAGEGRLGVVGISVIEVAGEVAEEAEDREGEDLVRAEGEDSVRAEGEDPVQAEGEGSVQAGVVEEVAEEAETQILQNLVEDLEDEARNNDTRSFGKRLQRFGQDSPEAVTARSVDRCSNYRCLGLVSDCYMLLHPPTSNGSSQSPRTAFVSSGPHG